jgi:transposase
MSVSLAARQEGVVASLLFQWRKLERQGALTAVSAGEAVVPASELAAARAEIAKLQRVLGKKTLENEILKEAVEYAAEKSGLRARPCWTGTASEGRLPGPWVGALEHSSLASSPRVLGRCPDMTHGACKRRDLARRDQGPDHRVADLWLPACLRIGEPA